MDKNIIKETMLSIEGAALQSAREKYFDYIADASLDRSGPIESDEQAQAEIASDLYEALDETLHDHTDKLVKLRETSASLQSRPLLKDRLCGFLVDTSSLRLRQQVHLRWSRGHRYFHNGPDFRGNRSSSTEGSL
jgi:hypothetical protein